MAWIPMQIGGGDSGDYRQGWYNTETGMTSDFNPDATPSGQVAQHTSFGGESGGNESSYIDPTTGRALADQVAGGTQYMQQLDDKFKSVLTNPNASSWDKAMAVQERYGIEALAQLAGQGHFQDIAAELGPHIAARQREGEAEGFSIGGNQLGLWPVILGMMGAGAYGAMAGGSTSAAAAPTAAGVGSSTATQVGLAGALEAGAGTAGAGAAGSGVYGGLDSAAIAGADYGAGAAGAETVGAGAGASSTAGETLYGTIQNTGLGTGETSALTNTATAGGGLTSLSNVLGGSGALSNLLGNSAGSVPDWMRLVGAVAPAALGAYASNEQSKDLAALGDKYFNVGAPSRARFESSFAPGFTMAKDPGYVDSLDQTTKSFLHKASVTGNPADSPNAWMQTLKDVNSTFAYPALQNYRNTNASAGGLASLATAAPGLDTQSVNAQRGVYDAIGAGAADIFTPRKSLADLLREARY